MNRAVDRRPLRADAARNVDKIIAAARQCFREHGPEVPLQTIAVTAGVGPATLFRNFADKEDAVAYSNDLNNNDEVYGNINPDRYQHVLISVVNYAVLMKDRKLSEYMDFYGRFYK